MKNFRNFLLAVSVMVGISAIESEGIYFWIALAMVIIPFAVLGIEEWNKNKAYKRAWRTHGISTTSPTSSSSASGK